ncbi:MAG: DUF1318 domain-containing protein [Bdellovibrionaceae bacterium]|nr:DUF1318 domain-containing protein [Pseudobdellovibrionaceae bacterium]
MMLAALLASCAPTIRLDTPEPVKIDVAMKVDVYSHEVKKDKQDGTAALNPAERRRNRMAEVQTLKNNRYVGEGNDGLLHVRELPTDPAYAAYAKEVLEAENADRNALFTTKAEEAAKPQSAIRSEFAAAARQSAFPGEWLQEDDGQWVKR